MNTAIKNVIDVLEKVYACPACFISLDDERRKALDAIMTTYARNRSMILREVKNCETNNE